jgi:NADH:ubiquinone oxidoreductase subunit 6 (subunit J)
MNFFNIISFDLSNDSLFLQFILILLLILFVTSTNNYYSLLYLFLLILFLGVLLCLLNNELTAGFLWVGEFLVIFVFLLLILYVNVHGDSKKFYNRNILVYSIFFLFFLFFYEHDTTFLENYLSFLDADLYWVDYYEALNDYNNNDLYGFYV